MSIKAEEAQRSIERTPTGCEQSPLPSAQCGNPTEARSLHVYVTFPLLDDVMTDPTVTRPEAMSHLRERPDTHPRSISQFALGMFKGHSQDFTAEYGWEPAPDFLREEIQKCLALV
jgi:hypothetical protein